MGMRKVVCEFARCNECAGCCRNHSYRQVVTVPVWRTTKHRSLAAETCDEVRREPHTRTRNISGPACTSARRVSGPHKHECDVCMWVLP